MVFQAEFRRLVAATILILLGTLWCGIAVAQNHAGQIMFTFGNVTITGANGAVRPAARGEQIFSGETVTTAAGRVQIRFTDGSLISLIPNSAYKIDDYQYSGQVDGSERGFFRLIKGGLRTVTGAIGKGDKENYRLTTPVATIGIRGTWFKALLDEFGRLLISVGFDPDDPSGLIVANAVGQIELDRGENAVVENADTPPVRTEQQVVIEPPPPPEEPLVVAGDDRNASGTQAILAAGNILTNLVGALTDNATEPPPGVDSAAFSNVSAVLGSPPVALKGDDVFGTPGTGVGIIDLNAALASGDPTIQSFVNNADPVDVSFFQQSPATVANFHDLDPVLLWGRFTGGRVLAIDNEFGTIDTEVDDLTGNQSWHFILGETPGDLSALNSSFAVATYNFYGGTPSTSESGASIGLGVTGGTLMVFFEPSPFVDVNMNVNHNGTNYSVFGNVDMVGPFFSDQAGGMVFGSGGVGACFGICAAAVDGFLAGPPAGPDGAPSHAGLSYIIFESDPIHGVAGFKQ